METVNSLSHEAMNDLFIAALDAEGLRKNLLWKTAYVALPELGKNEMIEQQIGGVPQLAYMVRRFEDTSDGSKHASDWTVVLFNGVWRLYRYTSKPRLMGLVLQTAHAKQLLRRLHTIDIKGE